MEKKRREKETDKRLFKIKKKLNEITDNYSNIRKQCSRTGHDGMKEYTISRLLEQDIKQLHKGYNIME